ncbi:hypothetical protein [Clostridium saccharoperbutylacetonicum]
MLNSTDQQKEKYFNLINGVFGIYDGMIKGVNSELISYGKEFFKFTSGITTENYFKDIRNKTKDNLVKNCQGTYTKMIDELKNIKEKYINECFPVTKTTDSLELDFIGKELSVMTVDEMTTFYEENLMDLNKVRLFDIEVKRRKMDKNKDSNLAKLDFLRKEYAIEDDVTKEISNKIKVFDAYRQVSSTTIALVTGVDLKPKMISYSKIFDYIEGKSRHASPKDVNINDLLGTNLLGNPILN